MEIGKKEKMAGHTDNIDIGGYYEVKSYDRLRPIMRINLFIPFFLKNGQKRSLRPISCLDLSPVNYGILI